MSQFTIKDLSELSGVKQHTIRIWEQRFNFLKPGRMANAQRTYTVEELNTLLDVALLNQNGYKISHIDKLEFGEKIRIVSSMFQQQQKAINDLIISMARMDAGAFENIIDNAFLSWGIHETTLHILLPFCDKIGLLEKGYTRKFQENIIIIRELIKQKIYLAIEKASPSTVVTKSVVLFLLAAENSELPILALQYLLKSAGYQTMFLGRDVSVKTLEVIHDHMRPQFLVTYLSRKNGYPDLVSFVQALRSNPPESTFISLEHSLAGGDVDLPSCNCFSKINDVLKFIVGGNI